MMSPRSLVYALCFAFVVSAARVDVQKRDAPFVPQRVNIPLSFDSQGRYVASVTMVSASVPEFRGLGSHRFCRVPASNISISR